MGVLKAIFARRGISKQLRSDNGPQFNAAEFAQFAKAWVSKNCELEHVGVLNHVSLHVCCKI